VKFLSSLSLCCWSSTSVWAQTTISMPSITHNYCITHLHSVLHNWCKVKTMIHDERIIGKAMNTLHTFLCTSWVLLQLQGKFWQNNRKKKLHYGLFTHQLPTLLPNNSAKNIQIQFWVPNKKLSRVTSFSFWMATRISLSSCSKGDNNQKRWGVSVSAETIPVH